MNTNFSYSSVWWGFAKIRLSETNGISEKQMVASFEIYIGTDFRKLQASSHWFKHTLDVSGVIKLAQKHWGCHAHFINDFDKKDVT